MIDQSILINEYNRLVHESINSGENTQTHPILIAIRLARFVEQATLDQCETDAKLGRLVRSMPDQWFLSQRVDGKWQVSNGVTRYVEDTPENALINAGCDEASQ